MAWGTQVWGDSFWGEEDTTETTAQGSLGHSLCVANIHTIGSLQARNAFNQFDEFGLLLGLPRIRGEKNWSYRRRLFDTFVHRANSSYRGLIFGVTRELGLTLTQPLQINPRRSISTGEFFAPDPYIKFDGACLYLYSDYANNVLDHKIDRYEPGGNYEHLGRLVEFINTTTHFEASLLSGANPYMKTMTILNQSNRVQVDIEDLLVTTKNKLENRRIVPSSVLLNDLNAFRFRVNTLAEVTTPGRYHIDYFNGIVTSYTEPSGDAIIRYHYFEYPFKPWVSPVILHDINSENFRVKLFQQILQDDGTYTHGLPTEIGVDIINELLTVRPMYWGI